MKTRNNRVLVFFMTLFVVIGVYINSYVVFASQTNTQNKPIVEGNVSKTIRKQNSNIEMETKYGLDGVVLDAIPTQMQISLTSKEDFTGSIRIRTVIAYENQRVAYGKDISLAKDSTKTFSFMFDAINSDATYYVELLDESEKVVYSESHVVGVEWGDEKTFIGVLSDDYGALTYFDGVRVGSVNSTEITSTLLKLDESNFPQNEKIMGMFTYLIIDNYDTGKLSEEQVHTIAEWVRDGGKLVLSLGANASNVLRAFPNEMIPVEVGNIEKKNINFNLLFSQGDEKGNQEEVAVINDVDTVSISLKDANEMSSFCEQQSAYEWEMEKGRVFLLGYDLAMEPVSGFQKKRELAQTFFNCTINQVELSKLNNMRRSGYYFDSVAKYMNQSPTPNAILFGCIFLIYAVLVGPILYLILKKTKKRDYIWVAIPMMSFLFLFIIYGLSSIYRVRKTLANSFTVISLEEEQKKERIFTNFVCPKAKDYRIVLEDEYQNISMMNTSSYYPGVFSMTSESNDEYTCMIKETNEGKEIDFKNSVAFETKDFEINRKSDNEIGKLDYKFQCYTDGIEGTITNQTIYDFENLIVYFDNRFCMIKELKQGECVSVSREDFQAANSMNNFYEWFMNSQVQDKEDMRNYYIASSMEEMYVDKDTFGTGYIWANIGTYEPKMFKDDSVKQYGAAVVYDTFTQDYEDAKGFIPDIMKNVVTSVGDFDDLDHYMYSNSVILTYSFEANSKIKELKFEDYSNKKTMNQEGICYAKVFAYNLETGEYDPIFEESDTLSEKELEKYIEGNIMMLRFDCIDDGESRNIPRISAKEVN